MQNITHLAFSDESKYNGGRYRGLGLVTLRQKDYGSCLSQFNELLRSSNIKDFKWKNLGSAREKHAAKKMINLSIELIVKDIIRIDVLSWDIDCSRHKIIGRDDIANLERMYYHLYRWVLGNRWPKGSIWALYPDEHSALNWDAIHQYLDIKGAKTERKLDFSSNPELWRLIKNYQVLSLDQAQSDTEPFIQLADLYVGMGVYSRDSFFKYQKWSSDKDGQHLLFGNDRLDRIELSKVDQVRCEILKYFKNVCDTKRLGVSIESTTGLKSHDPKRPINFWWYSAKHKDDKAPIKAWAAN